MNTFCGFLAKLRYVSFFLNCKEKKRSKESKMMTYGKKIIGELSWQTNRSKHSVALWSHRHE